MPPNSGPAAGEDEPRADPEARPQPHPQEAHLREAHPREAHPREDWGTQTTEIARDALREAAAAAVKRRRRRLPRLGRSG